MNRERRDVAPFGRSFKLNENSLFIMTVELEGDSDDELEGDAGDEIAI